MSDAIGNPNNPEKFVFPVLLWVSSSGRRKLTLDLYSTGQNSYIERKIPCYDNIEVNKKHNFTRVRKTSVANP